MKKDHKYSATVILQQEPASVLQANCICQADMGLWGNCKHLAALCYCLEHFVKIRSTAIQLDEASCTYFCFTKMEKNHLDRKMVEDILAKSAVFGKERKELKKKFMIQDHHQ